MKISTIKILLVVCSALLILADSVGKSTTLSPKGEERDIPDLSITVDASSSIMLADEVQLVDHEIVRKYAEEYGTDYRLMLALIKQESQFDENAISERGARGLMQIMPVTNLELNAELDLEESVLPRENIQAGIYYFSKLYRLFKAETEEDRMRLALAAYNAGPSRIYDAQELAAYLGENPVEWSSIQHVLPLLSRRYYTLHTSVWNDSRPPAGYFGSWKETTVYVDAVMRTYHRYLSML